MNQLAILHALSLPSQVQGFEHDIHCDLVPEFKTINDRDLFAKSTWIMSRAEIEWATGPAGKFAIDAPSFSAYESAKKKLIDGDLDVFGDGIVQILRTPGHTPGHQVLLLRLKSGSVLLSGDLYHLRRDVKERLIPIWNTNRADTLASFDRVERLVKNLHARLVVQHDPGDFQSLPHFPAFLQ